MSHYCTDSKKQSFYRSNRKWYTNEHRPYSPRKERWNNHYSDYYNGSRSRYTDYSSREHYKDYMDRRPEGRTRSRTYGRERGGYRDRDRDRRYGKYNEEVVYASSHTSSTLNSGHSSHHSYRRRKSPTLNYSSSRFSHKRSSYSRSPSDYRSFKRRSKYSRSRSGAHSRTRSRTRSMRSHKNSTSTISSRMRPKRRKHEHFNGYGRSHTRTRSRHRNRSSRDRSHSGSRIRMCRSPSMSRQRTRSRTDSRRSRSRRSRRRTSRHSNKETYNGKKKNVRESSHSGSRSASKSQSASAQGRVSAPSRDMNEGEEGTAQWKVGDTFRYGRYRVEKYLDSGAFSTVLQCFDSPRQRSVAVKIIRSVRKYLDSAHIEIDILTQVRKHDPQHKYHIIRFLDHFETRLHGQKHVCMVFEKMGCSLYQFVKKNNYRGFLIDDLREIAEQIIEAIKFCHEKLRLVHTDLKLENILLVDDGFTEVSHRHFGKKYRCPKKVNIRLIDFGGATYERFDENGKQTLRYETINTRQYRAPEVILGIGWDRKCDIWSIGCILCELYTGELLFSTHENIEHLAMMEQILESRIPKHMVEGVLYGPNRRKDLKRSMSPHVSRGEFVDDTFFDPDTLRLRWPEIAISNNSVKHVQTRLALKKLVPHPELRDLIWQCLDIDRKSRVSARQLLRHDFFKR